MCIRDRIWLVRLVGQFRDVFRRRGQRFARFCLKWCSIKYLSKTVLWVRKKRFGNDAVAVRRARTSDAVDAFPFPRNERDQKRERNTHNRVFVNTCFSSDFASPPSFSPIEIRTRKKERMRYSSLLLSSIDTFYRRRLRRPHELRVSVVSAMIIARAVLSVSCVCIHHGTRRITTFKFHYEEVKETREREILWTLKESRSI